MSSDDTPDLPVAGTFTLNRQYEQGIIWNNDPVDSPELEEGDEFVKRRDAEEAVQKARRNERQRILNKIEEQIEKSVSRLANYQARQDKPSNYKDGVDKVIEDLEELSGDLTQEEEVDELND